MFWLDIEQNPTGGCDQCNESLFPFCNLNKLHVYDVVLLQFLCLEEAMMYILKSLANFHIQRCFL